MAAVLAGGLLGGQAASARSVAQQRYLGLAEQGIARARAAFADNHQGLWNGKQNVPIRWYDERLGARSRYPLATVWGAVPLFEALAAVAIADPTSANRAALDTFAEGPAGRARAPLGLAARAPARHVGGRAILRGAEAYWDSAVGGYAPYPGDRGRPTVWFDDNAWWGLAFVDAYRALGKPRLLQDAQNAFTFIARNGWDRAGGLWWNTAHTPAGQKSGEPLAAGALLGAELAQAYGDLSRHAAPGSRAKANAAFDLQNSEKWLTWADAHFADANGLYRSTQNDPTPTPYITGPAVEAKQLLCGLAPAPNAYCAQASELADAAQRRFADRLNMGPQYDAIYLHQMLVYGQQTGDARWSGLARRMAERALAGAADPSTGLFERTWDGGDMAAHQAEPNMLRTDAATVELFGWLGAAGP